jgi:hypothetical protein
MARPELQANSLKRIYFDLMINKTALNIENQDAVCFSPPL